MLDAPPPPPPPPPSDAAGEDEGESTCRGVFVEFMTKYFIHPRCLSFCFLIFD
jgi:hypothetical protein